MRRVKYKGPDADLGVHGKRKKGDLIPMTERQISYCTGNDPDKYEVVDHLEDPDVFILPVAVKGQRDLRLIPWNQPHLNRHLIRMRRSQLLCVARAMFVIGMELDEFTKDTSAEVLADMIEREAKRHEWTKRGMQSNRELPIYDPDDESTHEVQFDLVRAGRADDDSDDGESSSTDSDAPTEGDSPSATPEGSEPEGEQSSVDVSVSDEPHKPAAKKASKKATKKKAAAKQPRRRRRRAAADDS